ncbi:MAG: FAD-dependent oxidoreductase [Rhodocyclaceae bacterium]|nr:FAD-dependent oxidoreductase [Rhodocyclaceae bacterium]
MEQDQGTLILGGGMAGMFCAMRLKEAGLPFLLVTERLGGRVMYKAEFKMNFGAVFYFDNYHHVKQIITPGPRVIKSFGQLLFHRSDTDSYSALSLRVLKHGWKLFRFLRFMKTFETHYEAYKKNCETMQVKEALKADPFMERLFFMTAQQFLDDLGVTEACRESVSLFAYACTGARVDTLTAFDYCYLAQGLLMPINNFEFSESAMQQRLGSVEFDSATKVDKTDGGYSVTTAKGRVFHARNLVIATTADAAQKLIDLPRIRSASRLSSYLVKGTLKAKYRGKDIHLFSDTSPVIYLARRDGSRDEYELYSAVGIDLADYFDDYSVRWQQDWAQAIYTHPALVLDQDLGDNLYMAGDHNGMGMEPAAISGIYAANRIIERSAV